MTEREQAFVDRAIRRRRLFLVLSIAGLAIAGALSILYAILRWHHPEYPIGPRLVIVLLILLNARQNLRQFRYSRVLEELSRRPDPVS